MPPKAAKASVTWSPGDAALMLKGFRELGWDPLILDGKQINGIIKATINQRAPEFDSLKVYFSVKEGGTRPSNNGIYKHYKDIASEYIVKLAKLGIRRKEVDQHAKPGGEHCLWR